MNNNPKQKWNKIQGYHIESYFVGVIAGILIGIFISAYVIFLLNLLWS